RQVGRLLALENAVDVRCCAPVLVEEIRTIGDQAARGYKKAGDVDGCRPLPTGTSSSATKLIAWLPACSAPRGNTQNATSSGSLPAAERGTSCSCQRRRTTAMMPTSSCS